MKQNIRTWCFVVIVAALFSGSAKTVAAAEIYPPDAVVFGETYSGWGSAWQQWSQSIPYAQHPLFDKGDCSTGQSGPVWFLGGKYCGTEEKTCTNDSWTRSCTVPAGKTLFFPIVNTTCLNIEAKKGFCGTAGPFIPEMRAAVRDMLDPAEGLSLVIDGTPVGLDLKNDYRIQGRVYEVSLPKRNMLQALNENIPPGNYWGIDEGVYVMLKPLSSGQHTITFGGTFPQYEFSFVVTYNLLVQ